MSQEHSAFTRPISGHPAECHDPTNVLRSIERHIYVYLSLLCSLKPMTLYHHRDAFAMATAHCFLRKQRTATKRDLYYLGRALFHRQENADAALNRVSRKLNTNRNDLNILSAPRGLVAGNLQFVDENGFLIDLSMLDFTPVLIPPRPERISGIKTTARMILV